MPSTATPREEPSTLTRLLRGAKRGARNVYDGATAQYFRPQEFAQGMSDAMVAAPDAIINALRSPRETIRAGLEATKDAFATPERTGATLVSAIPSLINALRGRGPRKDIIISGESVPRAQKLKLPISDYWVDKHGIPQAWLSDRNAKLRSQVVPLQNGNRLAIMGDTDSLPEGWNSKKGHTEFYTQRSPLFNGEVENLLRGEYDSRLPIAREFGDYIDHPDAFKLYPQLRHTPVDIGMSNTVGGGYRGYHDRIDIDLGTFKNTPEYVSTILDEFKGRRPMAPQGTYSVALDPMAALMHEGGGHAVHTYDNVWREYPGARLDEFPDDGLQYLQYASKPGEVLSRFVGGGSRHYTEDQLMSKGFVPKVLDLQHEAYAELLRGEKERQLKQGK